MRAGVSGTLVLVLWHPIVNRCIALWEFFWKPMRQACPILTTCSIVKVVIQLARVVRDVTQWLQWVGLVQVVMWFCKPTNCAWKRIAQDAKQLARRRLAGTSAKANRTTSLCNYDYASFLKRVTSEYMLSWNKPNTGHMQAWLRLVL